MKHLIIVGAGDFGRELHWYAKQSIGYGTEWDLKGFLDDNADVAKDGKLSMPLLGGVEDYFIASDDVFTCSICSPAVRKEVIGILLEKGAEFISIIHRTSLVQDTAKYGKGVVLSPYTIITDHAVVGNYVVLNSMAGVGHDAVIGDYTCMMAHVDITGYVHVGEAAYFGSGARALPHARIGNNAFIGAGSVVLKRVLDDTKVFGIPAVPI